MNENGVETGRWMLQRIIYIMDEKEYCKEGYVVLGLKDYGIINGSHTDKALYYTGWNKNENREENNGNDIKTSN